MNDVNNKDKEQKSPVEAFKIASPDPLPPADDIQKKIKTNRVPRPAPQKTDITQAKSEEPISSETISIKRSSLKDEEQPKIELEKRKLKILCYHCGQKLDLTEMEPFSEVECPACAVKIIVPKWFENYLLEEPGGEGGMAIVYRALDLTLDREVAIKILNPSFSSQADRCELFLHEARTAATINHYAVIPVYTCGVSEGRPYIVMQYMEGGALDVKLEKAGGKIPINQILKWFKDVADGLDNARRHGIIHHDVKPANILLDRDENAKIGDFGIAQVLHDWRSENLSKITRSWASPNYVSPEKVLTGQEDYYGDIYSLGISLYQMLTGQLPFDDPDIKTLVKMRLEKEAKPPKELRAEIPLKISQLVMAMMSREPEKRPSYREIIKEIEEQLKISDEIKKGIEKPEEQKKRSLFGKIGKRKKTGNANLSSFKYRKNGGLSISKIIVHIVISISMIGTTVYLWKAGYLEEILGRRGALAKTLPQDFLPEATKEFREGRPAAALDIAKSVLENSSLDKKTMRQAAVQYSIALYLINSPDAKTESLLFAEKLSNYGFDEEDPAMLILRFMSNGEIHKNKLKNAFSNDDYYRALASYCLYIKSIYDKESDLDQVSYSRRCLAAGEKVSSDFWGNAWFQRINDWKQYIEFGKGDPSLLEPLIAANKYELKTSAVSKTENNKSLDHNRIAIRPPKDDASDILKIDDEKLIENIDISLLTPEWLENDRSTFATNRPKPSNYTFTPSQIENYISSISPERKSSEQIRIQQVASIKNYICQLLARSNYPKTITTIDGKSYTGKLMLNPNYISLEKAGKFQRRQWSDLPPSQLANIMDYFAGLRLKVSDAVGTSEQTRKKEAAQDYLRIAMLYDWYGDYQNAVKYCKKSMAVYPEAEKSVKRFIMK
ncbi:MAG TPA: serine/threonine-protein kinase [Victivallales bacterium]|nr:serine/threonine-protein kinase [Victivallales bacterium]HPO90156.1 serine/threonine-protein kinase [Victivallales bacterium]HRR28050.1 serine/threonine-protein kinase [Victivallales bacterium]